MPKHFYSDLQVQNSERKKVMKDQRNDKKPNKITAECEINNKQHEAVW